MNMAEVWPNTELLENGGGDSKPAASGRGFASETPAVD